MQNLNYMKLFFGKCYGSNEFWDLNVDESLFYFVFNLFYYFIFYFSLFTSKRKTYAIYSQKIKYYIKISHV